ncbi:MAG: GGDEF domain-containing protein [Lacunisphaera sp.]
MLKATNRLPSPPAVAMRILQLVSSDETTPDDLARVISVDPALTAKIMKYLHSPLIGLGFHGTTLSEAVARIGTRGTQLLALSFSILSQKHHQSCPSFNFDRFWSQSLARAVACKRLATFSREWNPEDAFIAGLVFRIGQLVLATALPAEYEQVLKATLGEAGSTEAYERSALGTDQLEISYQLLCDWKLPKAIGDVIKPYTIFPRPPVDSGFDGQPASAQLGLADAIASFLFLDKQQQAGQIDTLIARARELGEMDRDTFRPLLDQIGQDWVTYGELLSIATFGAPDFDAIEQEAEEHRSTLRFATEMEVLSLRNENQQLSHLANRDRLTGLLNRGAFDDSLASGLIAAADKRFTLALLMIDLDHFKSINDHHGHQTGDEVLRHVSRIFHANVKAPAEVFRYGGEEFTVLIPTAKEDEAVVLAETLRQAIAHSPPLEALKAIAITVSIGVAWTRWPDRPMTSAALVQAADQRMYEAKRAGRNACRYSAPCP